MTRPTRRSVRTAGRLAALLATLALAALVPGEVEGQQSVVLRTRADGWLGLSVQEDLKVVGDRTWTGITVLQVAEDGPSQRAGLRTGDRVIEVNGRPAVPALFNQVASGLTPGQSMRLLVRRPGGEEREVVVTAAPRPGSRAVFLTREMAAEVDSKLRRLDSLRVTLSGRTDGVTGVVVGPGAVRSDVRTMVLREGDTAHVTLRVDSPRTGAILRPAEGAAEWREAGPSPLLPYVEGLHWVGGARLTPLSEDLAAYFEVEGGLLVTELIEGTLLPEAGLRPGDVLVAVGGRRVLTLEPVRAALSDRWGSDVVLSVVRHGEALEIRIPGRRR